MATTDWNKLEGQYYRIDVGTSSADAIADTANPSTIHYTTDGEVVMNGINFSRDSRIKDLGEFEDWTSMTDAIAQAAVYLNDTERPKAILLVRQNGKTYTGVVVQSAETNVVRQTFFWANSIQTRLVYFTDVERSTISSYDNFSPIGASSLKWDAANNKLVLNQFGSACGNSSDTDAIPLASYKATDGKFTDGLISGEFLAGLFDTPFIVKGFDAQSTSVYVIRTVPSSSTNDGQTFGYDGSGKDLFLPVATTENAGIITCLDKRKWDGAVEDLSTLESGVSALKEYVEERVGTFYSISFVLTKTGVNTDGVSVAAPEVGTVYVDGVAQTFSYGKTCHVWPLKSFSLADVGNDVVPSGYGFEWVDFSRVYSLEEPSYLCYGDTALKELDLSGVDFSAATSLGYLVYNSVVESVNLSKADFSNVGKFEKLFDKVPNLKTIVMSYADFYGVSYFDSVFSSCTALETLDVSHLNSRNGTYFGSMFSGCTALKNLKLDGMHTENGTYFGSMFSGCTALTSLDLSSLDFGNATNMTKMFSGCSSLATITLGAVNTSKNKNFSYMFENCSSLSLISGTQNMNVANGTSFSHMFEGCSALAALDLSNWNTSKGRYFSNMFNGCTNLQTIKGVLDFTDMSSNASYRENMFAGCSSLVDFGGVKNLKYPLDFSDCPKLSVDSVMNIFNGLLSVSDLPAITLNSVVKSQLTSDQLKVAEDKGWRVVGNQ